MVVSTPLRPTCTALPMLNATGWPNFLQQRLML